MWNELRNSSASAADDDWIALNTEPDDSIVGQIGTRDLSPRGVKFGYVWTDDDGVIVPSTSGTLTLSLIELVTIGDIEALVAGQAFTAYASTLYTYQGLKQSDRFTVRVSAVSKPTGATRYAIGWEPF